MALAVRRGTTITYWAPKSTDVFGGDTFYPPKHIKARWESSNELIRVKTGEEDVVKSVIYLNDALDINGYLYNGISHLTDPRAVDGASEIRQVGSMSDLRNLKQMNVAYV